MLAKILLSMLSPFPKIIKIWGLICMKVFHGFLAQNEFNHRHLRSLHTYTEMVLDLPSRWHIREYNEGLANTPIILHFCYIIRFRKNPWPCLLYLTSLLTKLPILGIGADIGLPSEP